MDRYPAEDIRIVFDGKPVMRAERVDFDDMRPSRMHERRRVTVVHESPLFPGEGAVEYTGHWICDDCGSVSPERRADPVSERLWQAWASEDCKGTR